MQKMLKTNRIVFACAVLGIVLAILSSTAYLLWRLRVETLHREFDVAALTARTLEDHLTYSLNVADRSMVMAAETYQGSDWLPHFVQQTPFLRSLSLADLRGNIFASSTTENVGHILPPQQSWPLVTAPSESMRVTVLQSGRDIYQGLSPASGARVPGGPVFLALSREVMRPDDRWLTPVATLNPDYFINFYSSHIARERGQVSLLRYDGEVLFSSRAGKVDYREVLSRIARRESGQFQVEGPDGGSLLLAYRVSANYPFILVVALDEAYALQSWQREVSTTGWTVLVLLSLLLVLAVWYYWHYERISRMRERDEADLRIAAAAFEAQEGIFITDVHGTILRANRALCAITGYAVDEVVGRNPRLFSSGRHDAAFYAAMWQAVGKHGAWQGEVWNRRKNGEVFPEWLSITAVHDQRGEVTHYVSTLVDITQRKRAEDEIRLLAFYDPLTGLPNRRLLRDRLQQVLSRIRQSGRGGALLFIDLDHFKNLNDTLGHDKGDLLLQQVAQRLLGCVGEEDTVSRQGGDEFVVLLSDLAARDDALAMDAWQLAERIRCVLGERHDLAGCDYDCTPSIGIALFSAMPVSADELLKQADLALYGAKSAGRNCCVFFDPAMQAAASRRAMLEADVRRAWDVREFALYYQLQCGRDGKPSGAEVLLRWPHPQRGMVSPVEFIPLMEESGLIIPVGWWVIDAVCQVLRRWQDDEDLAAIRIAVNVSARQLYEADFISRLTGILHRHAINPARLELELTESVLLEHIEETIGKMSVLRELGIGFALDDFGTGYSSLAYLKRLPLSQLKIDQSFVRELLEGGNAATIACSIIGLAHNLGLTVLAEGVETEGQQAFLAEQGCDAYQGYLFGRPEPLAELESRVRGLLV